MSQARHEPPRDRTAGLVLFGILWIAAGLGCALLVPATLVLVAFRDELPPGVVGLDLRQAIPGLSLYALMAVALPALGVGSIRARRWAVTLSQTVAWIWLVSGVLSLGTLAFAWPALTAGLGLEAGGGPVAALALVVVFAFSAVVCVVVPGALVLFYRSPHVRATCERRNPEPDWSDRCPPSVLALASSHALLAYSVVLLAPYRFAIPFFGVILTGPLAGAVIVGSVAANLWIAREMYRLRPASWWAGLGVILALSVSVAVTFARVDPLAYYALSDVPREQIELVRSTGMAGPAAVHVTNVVFAAAYVTWLLYVRRHFTTRVVAARPPC